MVTSSGFGDSSDQFNRGLKALETGDFSTALSAFRSLAGHVPEAQFNLGMMYAKGLGVTQDREEALKWYRKSAERGMKEAQYNLGNSYFYGRGVANDYKEAAKWYLKSAEQGMADAQNAIAIMYAEGKGVNQDAVYAHMWFILGASGNKDAIKNRDIFAKQLSAADLSKAQERARMCVMKYYRDC